MSGNIRLRIGIILVMMGVTMSMIVSIRLMIGKLMIGMHIHHAHVYMHTCACTELGAQAIDVGQLFDELDKDGDSRLSRDELVEGLSKEGVKEGEIKALDVKALDLIKALDVSKDGQISRDEWSRAWARSEAALCAAAARGHTNLESEVSVLTQVMKRPESVDFKDVRQWTRIELDHNGIDRVGDMHGGASFSKETGGEFGWPMRSMNAEALPAAGCAIAETAVQNVLLHGVLVPAYHSMCVQDRGITLRQLLAVWEHIKTHCAREGWTDWKGNPLTPDKVRTCALACVFACLCMHT